MRAGETRPSVVCRLEVATVDESQVRGAVEAAMRVASALGLGADEALVIQNSNRVTLRLLPCDVLARVAPLAYRERAMFEVEVARKLAAAGGPVAELEPWVEPGVHIRDRFAVNLWRYYEAAPDGEVSAADYATVLGQLHAAMREIDVTAPHFTERIAEAQELVGDPSRTPELHAADRALLNETLRDLRRSIGERGAPEQLLHGEPHPGNVLNTTRGLVFIDFETTCCGPIEFDVAHMPYEVSRHYPGADAALVAQCRVLVLAMVAAWRLDRGDDFPDGRRMGNELLRELRSLRPVDR